MQRYGDFFIPASVSQTFLQKISEKKEKRGHERDGGDGARARTFNYYIIGGYLLYIGGRGGNLWPMSRIRPDVMHDAFGRIGQNTWEK